MRAAAGTRIRLAGAVLASTLAFPASVAASGVCPPPVPFTEVHADERHVVLLATATPDTVNAGWADLDERLEVRRPRRWRTPRVYGQTARMARVGGPGAAGLTAGPVVLVPWAPGCGGIYRQWESFAWLPPGAPDIVVVGRLRPPEHWAGGVPTVDVLRTDLVRRSRPGIDPGERFDFYATLPARQQVRRDPWSAVAPMRAWLAAHPEHARDRYVRYVSAAAYRDAAWAAVTTGPSPLAGTYRIEVSRTDGPTHVVWARTELVPRNALFPADTTPAVFPDSASGYSLRAEFRREVTELPTPRPDALTRFWRRLAGTTVYDELEVWLPGEMSADGSRRFRGHLGLWNVTHVLFPDDRELGELIHDWSRRETSNMRVQNPVGEIVLRPDGTVEWTQVMELAPGRAVTLRATRVSDEALHVPVDR